MTDPKDGEKRWIRRKGCKNAAKQWRQDLQMWVVVPMVIGKPVSFVTDTIFFNKPNRISIKYPMPKKKE